MARSDHFVQFYEASDFPVASVGAYLREGLINEESCIVAALPEHLKGVREELWKAGVDLAAASAEERFIELDVNETLGRIMVDGMPDLRIFGDLVRPLVQETSTNGKVRIFGELVAVLASQNNLAASLKLEEYWNTLQEEFGFSLFCSYPDGAFVDAGGREALLSICDKHTHVISKRAFTESATGDDRLKSVAFLQQWNEQLYAELAELERNISERNRGAE